MKPLGSIKRYKVRMGVNGVRATAQIWEREDGDLVLYTDVVELEAMLQRVSANYDEEVAGRQAYLDKASGGAARVARLEAALKPFAELLSHYENEKLIGKDFFWNPSVKGEEIVNAREALARPQESEKK